MEDDVLAMPAIAVGTQILEWTSEFIFQGNYFYSIYGWGRGEWGYFGLHDDYTGWVIKIRGQ